MPGATGTSDRAQQPGGVSARRVLELVDARRQHSLRYNLTQFNRLQGYYDTYRGIRQKGVAQFRNNISIPFTFAMIQADVARKVQTSFGSWPIVTFEGYAPEDAPRAKRNEVLVSAQMKDADSVIKATSFLLQADICGTAIARYGWKNITRKNRYRRRENVAPGLDVTVVHEGKATMFDGPVWDVVDRLDFWQQPGRQRIQDMAWVIHRYWVDLDELDEDAASPYPYFDAAAVQELHQYPLEFSPGYDFAMRRLAYRTEVDYQARYTERFAKPVEVWEMHGMVPAEFAPDGVRMRCIAIGNGRVVLKNREGPMGNGTIPFLSYTPMVDPYSFDGAGKAEVAYGPQRTIDRLSNQKLDALDLLIDPMYVASNSVNLNTQHLFSRAGRILLVDGAADESNLRALTPDMRGLQAAYTEVGQLFQFMQLGTGETESLLGLGGGGSSRETARGFLGRQENAVNRLAFEDKLLGEGFVEPLGNAFRRMDQQWLTLPHEVKILGSVAATDPVTGLPYQGVQATVDYDDLEPDYRARAVGAVAAMGMANRQQNFLALTQMFSANPALLQLINWASWAREAVDLFGFKNGVSELLVSQVPMVNQVAQQSGQSPETVAQTVQQGLPQLGQGQVPPELLALFNRREDGQILNQLGLSNPMAA